MAGPATESMLFVEGLCSHSMQSLAVIATTDDLLLFAVKNKCSYYPQSVNL